MTLDRLCCSGILGKQSTIGTFRIISTKENENSRIDTYVNSYYVIDIGRSTGNIRLVKQNITKNYFYYLIVERVVKEVSIDQLNQKKKNSIKYILEQFDEDWNDFITHSQPMNVSKLDEWRSQTIFVGEDPRISFSVHAKNTFKNSIATYDKSFTFDDLNKRLLYYNLSSSVTIDQRNERSSAQAKSVALKFLYKNKIKVPIKSLSSWTEVMVDERATLKFGGDGPTILTSHWVIKVNSSVPKYDGKVVIVASGNLKDEDPPRFSVLGYY